MQFPYHMKRRKAPRAGIRDEDKVPPAVERKHFKWLRGWDCIIAGKHDCEGRIEVCHVRQGLGGGMALKPGPERTVPMCSAAHRRQHQVGEKQFEREFGISMLALAERFAAMSPALKAWKLNGEVVRR